MMKTEHVASVREFNRFYTNVIGLLDKHLLNSPYSLPEARIIYELHHRQPCTASDLMMSIEMDKGYLSRVLSQFIRKGLLTKKKSKDDGRASVLLLTAKGQSEFHKLNQASIDQIKSITQMLSFTDYDKLINHMKAIQKILNDIK